MECTSIVLGVNCKKSPIKEVIDHRLNEQQIDMVAQIEGTIMRKPMHSVELNWPSCLRE